MKYFIGLIVVAVLVGGGYYLYKNYAGTQPSGQDQVATETSDQVRAQEVTVGTGTQAAPGSVVSVLYVGRFADGTIFDSSEAHGNEPHVFQLEAPGTIAGFQIGVNGMREGGERLLEIPPSLGYGGEDFKDPTSGEVIIPGNSTLIFEVKLLKVETATSTPTATTTAQ